MRFLYEYRTPDNERHKGEIRAADKEAAYSALKRKGIKPCRFDEAPGFFNKLFGKGKRWILIGVLGVGCVVLGAVVYTQGTRHDTQGADDIFDSMLRRQVIGDAAIIEKGVATGWSDVFALEGERFLASFAIPGVPPGLRNTTEEEIGKALRTPRSALRTPHTLEERQIRAMVEGMKVELRDYLAEGGTIASYGRRLVRRQEEEIAYYNRTKVALETAAASGMGDARLEAMWESENARLRNMGIRLVPMPRQGVK